MDKGFNDDELADIMNEIESLEKEFNEEPAEQVEAHVEVEAEAVVEEEQVVEVVAEEAPVVEDEITEDPVMEEPVIEEVEAVVEEIETVVEEPIAEQEPELVEQEVDIVAAEHEDNEVDTEMEEVLSELSDMPVDDVVAKHEAHDDEVVTLKPNFVPKSAPVVGGGQSSMSFTVEGDMKLDLSFNVSGKVVHLNINENGFELELEGGMKFSIPLDEAHLHKKAA